MKRAVSYITLLDMVFVLILSISGLLSGFFSEAVYYLAFLMPVLIAYLIKRKFCVKAIPPSLKFSTGRAPLFIPFIAPTLALIFLISFLTSLLLSPISDGSVTDVSGNIVFVIFKHAILTALLEEVLFRYIPISFIIPYGSRATVLISALLFSLAHCNLYQMPYAFFAGIVFCALDMAFESFWPSLILHFLNNLISIFWLRYFDNSHFFKAYVITLTVSALISAVIIFLYRKRYKEIILKTFADKSKFEMSYVLLLFAALTLSVAITNL